MNGWDAVLRTVGEWLLVGYTAAMLWVSFGPAPRAHVTPDEETTPIEWSAFGG